MPSKGERTVYLQHSFEFLSLAVGADGGQILVALEEKDFVGRFRPGEETVRQRRWFVVANPGAIVAGFHTLTRCSPR
jgi:hypothetical protein